MHAFWKDRGLFQVGEQRLCDQVRMFQSKGCLLQPQLEEIKRFVESGENNAEAQHDVQNRTGTEPYKRWQNNILQRMRNTKGDVKKIQNY